MESENILLKIHQIEERYFNNPSIGASHLLFKGKGPVVISAPHSVAQTREGKLKFSESRSGVLAVMLHEALGCHCIIKTKHLDDDANFDEKSPYKEDLRNYIKEMNLKFLLDVHLMAPFRGYDVDLGTGKGVNIDKSAPQIAVLRKKFAENKISEVRLDYMFDAVYPYTVSAYIAKHCRIPALQLEINSSLVYEEFRDSFKFYSVLKSLRESLIEIIKFS